MRENKRTSRYNVPGTQPNLSGKLVAIAAVLIAIAIIIVAVQYFQRQRATTVSATQAGIERVDDHTLRSTVDITRKNPDAPAYCIVTALNYNKAEVGRREVLVPAGGAKTQPVTVDIPTNDEPVASTVYGCSDIIPDYLQ